MLRLPLYAAAVLGAAILAPAQNTHGSDPAPSSIPLGASSESAPAATVHELPLAYVEGRILVPAQIEGVGEKWFILDTAAGGSVISGRIRAQLEVGPAEIRSDTVQGATGPIVLESVRLPGLRVGGVDHADLWPVVADISDFRDHGGRAVEGILGVDVLARYDVVIDIPASVLRLHPADGSAARSFVESGPKIPFHSSLQEGFVQFTPTLHGTPVEAILDTGAKHGTMNWHAASLAGISSDGSSSAPDARKAGGMSGERVPVETHPVDRLCLGDLCWPPTPMNVVDLPIFRVAGYEDEPAMLFGAELLEHCPVLIAYSSDTFHLCSSDRTM